jgi:hypothetical protein
LRGGGEPLLQRREILRRHGEGAMLHAADGVALGLWLGAFRDLEEREQRVVARVPAACRPC